MDAELVPVTCTIEAGDSTAGSTTLGEHLLALRTAMGESQHEFGARLGVVGSHVSMVERGEKGVRPERAARWAAALGVSERILVQLAIQDQLRRLGLPYVVRLAVRSHG